MKKLLIASLLLAVLVVGGFAAKKAYAYTCTTSCYFNTCTTNCW